MHGIAETRAVHSHGELCSGLSSFCSEDKTLCKRVASQAVGSVHRDTRDLSGCIETRQSCESMDVGVYSAHLIVLTGSDGNGLVGWVYPDISLSQLFHERQFLLDYFFAEMCQVKVDIASVGSFESSSRVNLTHLGPGQDVSGSKFHFSRNIPFQETFAVLVQQVAAFASCRFRDQNSGVREKRGMVLDHLHILQRYSGAIGEGHSVACLYPSVGCELENSSASTGRYYHCLA